MSPLPITKGVGWRGLGERVSPCPVPTGVGWGVDPHLLPKEVGLWWGVLPCPVPKGVGLGWGVVPHLVHMRVGLGEGVDPFLASTGVGPEKEVVPLPVPKWGEVPLLGSHGGGAKRENPGDKSQREEVIPSVAPVLYTGGRSGPRSYQPFSYQTESCVKVRIRKKK